MTEAVTNRQWLINGNPRGRALALADFKAHEAGLAPLSDGQVRVRAEYLSFDPSQKGQMENIAGYTSGAEAGQVMSARGIGEVVESRCEDISPGAKVAGPVGWQEYATLTGSSVEALPDDELLTAHLGAVGGTGLTAYFGLLRIGRPEPGDTIVICGGISRYQQGTLPPGPANYFNIVFRQAIIEGFLLSGYENEYAVARRRITEWLRAGEIVYKEDVQHGFDNIPATLLRLFSGKNFGKQLLKFG